MHWQFINNCLSNSPVSRVKQHPTMHFYLEQWVRVSPYNRSNKSERTAVPIYYHFAIKYRLFNWLCIFIILSTVQIDNDQPSHPSHLPLIPTNATSTILSPIINIARLPNHRQRSYFSISVSRELSLRIVNRWCWNRSCGLWDRGYWKGSITNLNLWW